MFKPTAALLGAVFALSAGVAHAKPKPPKGAEIEGTITAVTASTGTTPLQVTISGKSTVTLNVVPATRIELDDQAGSPNDLHVGEAVDARYDPTTLNAATLEISNENETKDAQATGTVLSASNDSLSLDVNGDRVPDLTLSVTPQTRVRAADISLNGAPLSVLIGLRVGVEYVTGSFQAREIDVLDNQTSSLTGKVSALDLNAGTLTLQSGSTTQTFLIEPGTQIRVGDRTGTLSGVTVGDTATVTYLGTGSNAVALRIQDTPQNATQQLRASGVVTDASASSITLRRADNSTLTLTVNGQTRIHVEDFTLTPAELSSVIGQQASVTYNSPALTATDIAVSEKALSTVTGQVTAVNTTAGTLTVQKGTTTLTFQVPQNAQIRVGDRPATLADLRVGDTVSLTTLGSGAGALALQVRESSSVSQGHVEGILTAVGTSTITVRPKTGASVDLVVNSSTDLRINGKRATLAQLTAALAATVQNGRVAKVSAQYVTSGGTNTATQVRVNVRGRGED